MGGIIKNQCNIHIHLRVSLMPTSAMRRVCDREPLAGDGVAEIVVVVAVVLIVVLNVVLNVVAVDERRAKEETVEGIEDGCVGMGRQEAEGVISAGSSQHHHRLLPGDNGWIHSGWIWSICKDK